MCQYRPGIATSSSINTQPSTRHRSPCRVFTQGVNVPRETSGPTSYYGAGYRDEGTRMTSITTYFLIELSGWFWILSELAILYVILLVARRISQNNPRPGPLFDPHTRRTAQRFLVAFSLIAALGLSRHGAAALQNPDAAPDALHTAWEIQHLIVWTAMVTAWVLLECAIVAAGLHAVARLRQRLGEPHPTVAIPVAVALAAALLAAGGFFLPRPPDSTRLPEGIDLYRNALYAYLRIAGVVWIAVEWMAAITLVQVAALLTRRLRRRTAP